MSKKGSRQHSKALQFAVCTVELHSQVLEALKVAHRAGDFTTELVAGEIKSLEVCQLANLCWDWPTYVVVLQETAPSKDQKKEKKISFNSNKNWSCQGYSTNAHPWTDVRKKHHSHNLKIGQVADAWREQAREMLAWSFPEKYSEYSDKQQMRGRMRVAHNVFKVWWRDSASTIYVTMYCSL